MNSLHRVRLTRVISLSSALFLALVLLSACASTPVAPTGSLTDARDAIAQAEQDGARQYAGGELDEAHEKLRIAEQAVAREEMVEAGRLANEAEAMAMLASAKTEAAKAAEINRQMERGAEALDEEMDRMGDQ